MEKTISLKLLPSEATDEQLIRNYIARAEGVKGSEVSGLIITRQSIDARARQIWINISLKAYINEPAKSRRIPEFDFPDVGNTTSKVIIIGAGPAGLFAAMQLIEKKIKPILLERGKDVRARR